MTLKAFKDATFNERVDSFGEAGYKVRINPETFDRTLTVNKSEDKTARPGNSSGHNAGLGAETYAFDLYFDGTGVAGTALKGKALKEEFQTFLEVVYVKREDVAKKKQPNCVTIEYCGETFHAKLTSMTIKYLLFQRDGNPLRIKASCSFASVEEEKPDPEAGKKKQKKKPKDTTPNARQGGKTKESIGTDQSFDETVSSARENNSESLMNCHCTC